MDIQHEIKEFLRRYQTTGWLIALMVGGIVLQGILLLIFAAIGKKDGYYALTHALVLPYSLKGWLSQPWSIVTWPFFTAKIDFLRLLVNGLILWAFGRIHQQLLGEVRTRRLVMLAIPIIGILTITFSSLVNYQSPEMKYEATVLETPATGSTGDSLSTVAPMEGTENSDEIKTNTSNRVLIANDNLLRPSGMIAIIMVLVVSCITLVPHYPIQLFLFGQVKIVWVGVVLLFIELIWAGLFNFISPLGIAIAIGGGLGFLHVYLLKQGTDITEIIWSYYQDSKSRPKMKVKYGEAKPREATKSSAKASPKAEVTEDIINVILDKINDNGYESLTREEKELLFKASTQKEDENKE